MQKGQQRDGGITNSRVEGKDRGRHGQPLSVGKNGRGGQERMHGVDNMDTEGNSKEGKTGNVDGGIGMGREGRVNEGRKDQSIGMGMI